MDDGRIDASFPTVRISVTMLSHDFVAVCSYGGQGSAFRLLVSCAKAGDLAGLTAQCGGCSGSPASPAPKVEVKGAARSGRALPLQPSVQCPTMCPWAVGSLLCGSSL